MVLVSVSVSVCLSVCLSVYLSVYLPVCLAVCLSACLSVCLSICLSICLSVYLSVYLSVLLYIYIHIHIYIFGTTCFYQGFPESQQLFLEICRASYWSSKHLPGPSVWLIHSNPRSFIHLKFVFIHVNITKVLLVVKTLLRSAATLFSSHAN